MSSYLAPTRPTISCNVSYIKKQDLYIGISGAALKGHPDFADFGGHHASWLGFLHSADSQVKACWINGGRYWQMLIDVRARTRIKSELGLCAPAQCSRDEVESEIVPLYARYLEVNAQFPDHRLERLVRGGRQNSLSLSVGTELSSWMNLKLDFVIAGVHGCGSTSVFMNLRQHPNIEFTDDGEDQRLFTWNFLPSVSLVNDLNSQTESELKEKVEQSNYKIRGLLNPALFSTAHAVDILTLIPNLKVVVITGDPVRVFEKDVNDYAAYHLVDQASAFKSISDRVRRHGSVLGHALLRLSEYFAGRLVLVHQTHLRQNDQRTLRYIAHSLGVTDYPVTHTFHRYNMHHTQRGFCKNRTLVRELQSRFVVDYEANHGLLLQRQLPIDWVIEKHATYCDLNGWKTSRSMHICPWNRTGLSRACRGLSMTSSGAR